MQKSTVVGMKKAFVNALKSDYLIPDEHHYRIIDYIQNKLKDDSPLLDPYDREALHKFLVTYARHKLTPYDAMIRGLVKSSKDYEKIKSSCSSDAAKIVEGWRL